jgi:hypothetical protein
MAGYGFGQFDGSACENVMLALRVDIVNYQARIGLSVRS